jgi:hypothetical protein
MEEIFRYQQLRQTQKLSEQEKMLVGLPLYPEQNLSELATHLVKADSSDAYASVLARYIGPNRENIIEDLSKIDPTIRSLYEWLNFKARPIKKDDFKNFVDALPTNQSFDLDKAWNFYADNFIVAINDKNISINYCVDFQLLIRICYLFKLCIEINDGQARVKDGISAALLNAILTQPVLLPALILRSRCSTDCREKGKVELPRIPAVSEGRGENPCEYKYDEPCQSPSGHCICINTYIADLFIIKEELTRYEEGDIAHIENMLAGESKVRRHRNLYRTEETTETENETITNEERDHQTNEKSLLQSEVKKTIDAKVGIDAGITETAKYGEAVTVTHHANVTANFSKSQAANLARSYAKEIVDRSVAKIQEKVRKLQVSKLINEMEERNKHSIENTQTGAEHRAGIYYWVNKVTHAQVFNYGKHLMFDVIVPVPAQSTPGFSF